MSELREKIEERLDFLSEHWGMDDRKPFSFGGWRDEVLSEIMQLIQAERTKAKEEVISRLQTWWLKGTEHEPFSAVIDELKQSLAEKGTDE